jgi:hypothetical protein
VIAAHAGTRSGAVLVRVVALAAAATPCAALLACGDSAAPGRAAAAERAAEQNAETRFDDFARCLREHGVNAEAQSRPGGAHGLKIMGGDAAVMHAAEQACARYRPAEQRGPSRLSPQEEVEIEERLERVAKCMREHGVEVTASTADGGPHIEVPAPNDGGGPEPESPAFKAAQKACSNLLPGAGSAAGGAASGRGSGS